MNKIIVTVAFTLLFTSVAYGQGESDAQKPTTKLEAFQAKTGIVVIRGYTTVGSVRGAGTVTVDAREFRDASNIKNRQTGVSITVQESGRLERENTSFIDSDEIESLLAGLDYISKATNEVTQLTNFECEYRTKGNFSITVFNNTSGELAAVVSAGYVGKTSAYIKLSQLSELRQLIINARSKT